MRKMFGPVLVTAFALLALGASTALAGAPGTGAKSGTIAAKHGPAKTLDELVKMYDSTSCRDCHEEIYDQWKASPHARSIFGTGRTAATFRTAIMNGLMSWKHSGVHGPGDVTVENLQGCTKCHLPQLADATDAVAKDVATSIFDWYDAAKKGDKAKRGALEAKLGGLGVNCLICHNRNAITHKWADGYAQAGVVYGDGDGEHDADSFPRMGKSPIMHASILCGQCHGLGPNLEFDEPTQCATAYGSYLFAYRAEGGHETCQSCHMERSGLGHKILSYSSKKMAEMAVDFDTDVRAVYWRDGSHYAPRVSVTVAMTNRAGHAIPDG